MGVTQDILGHYKLDRNSVFEDYDAVAHLPAGCVFKIVGDDYEQVMLNMQTYFPTFEANYVHPGTELYTVEGSGAMVVVTPAID